MSATPLDRHVEHALGFADLVVRLSERSTSRSTSVSTSTSAPTSTSVSTAAAPAAAAAVTGPSGPRVVEAAPTILDLGSGGGIPGLVLAERFPDSRVLLVEGSTRRAGWLQAVTADLDVRSHVEVVGERAELAAHRPALRGSCSYVIARSFGRPATTAECGAGFLEVGGWMVVSEPPTPAEVEMERWPAAAVRQLGLGPAEPVESRGFHYVVLPCVERCPDRYPRRVGIPDKRPLF